MANEAEAVIEKGNIVIRVPINNLRAALRGAMDAGIIEPGYVITSREAAAKSLCLALNDSDEDGASAVHQMFDAAFERCIEDGAEGFDEAPATAPREGTP